uniref:ATP-binding cassette domain-containing protein n=1 Tax=Prevotella sp. GTC17260 TaxID=3236796 RepID=A0AB33JF66_9BACT
MVIVEHLSKRYGSQPVLEDIDFKLDTGKIYGIMGENGAGKSTLFRCLMGLEKYGGAVNVDGDKGAIGYLPDIPFYYSYVTGYEYVEFCLEAQGLKVSRADIDEANRQLRLPLERFATGYSLGMQKRLALLALMLQRNPFYILDEPFNGMDMPGTLLLKRWMKDVRQHGGIVLLSSHIISSLTDVCDEIFCLYRGTIARRYVGASAETIENDMLECFLTEK